MKTFKKYILPPLMVLGITYLLNSVFVFGPSGYIARGMVKKQIENLDRKIHSLERENLKLSQKLADLQNGNEVSLRDYGFIKDGEKVYSFIVVGEKPKSSEEKSTLMGKAILLSGALFLVSVAFTVVLLSI